MAKVFKKMVIRPPLIVRLDGKDFHRLPDVRVLQKPFDKKFHSLMTKTTKVNLLFFGESSPP